MSRRKTERLFGLVQCLLAARHYLTAQQIREAVPGYPASDEAFKRMFERDKDELRELGVPVLVGSDGVWESDVGYRIDRSAYELPEIDLTPDEAAVLGLAARVWQRANLAGAAAEALLKLRAAGVETTADAGVGFEPRLTTQEPAFLPLWQAVRDARPVTFEYRTAGRATSTRRSLEPWGVVAWRGRWYVAGYDRDRADVRVFRLSRISGEVEPVGEPGSVEIPDGVDIRKLVSFRDDPNESPRIAALRIRKGAATGIRRFATDVRGFDDVWDRATIEFHSAEWLAGYVASFADDVIIDEPSDAREAVINRLEGAVARGEELDGSAAG